jgi:hypothetical protein
MIRFIDRLLAVLTVVFYPEFLRASWSRFGASTECPVPRVRHKIQVSVVAALPLRFILLDNVGMSFYVGIVAAGGYLP